MTVVSKAPKTIAQLGIQSAATWAQDNGTWLKAVIDKHEATLKENQVELYQSAYDGEIESIKKRERSRDGGTENKLQVNLAQVVIDTPVDYMLGKPPVWTVEDPEKVIDDKTGEVAERPLVTEYKEKIIKLLTQRDIQRVLAEQLRQGGIAGESPVISWVDEKGQIDFEEFPINECIAVLDTRGRLVMLIRHYMDDVIEGNEVRKRKRLEIYDDKFITYYIGDETGATYSLDSREFDTTIDPVVADEENKLYIYEGNPIPHMAGRIPVSLFINGQAASYSKRGKRAGTSDLGNGVMSLLEAYAHGVSDKANLAEYLQDQYLLLKGVDVDEGEVIKMRKARALALKSKESDASFIAQDQADGAIENYLNRLENLIYDQTFTPKLKDLSGATATEIKMKYANLDIKTGKKEIYFKGAIKQLIIVLTDFLNAKRLIDEGVERDQVYEILSGQLENNTSVELYDPDWMAVTLNRNLPQNYQEIATIVSTLDGIVPESYLFELLWFIEDPAAAIKEMKAQRAVRQQEAADAMYGSSANGGFTDPNADEGGGSGNGGGDTGEGTE